MESRTSWTRRISMRVSAGAEDHCSGEVRATNTSYFLSPAELDALGDDLGEEEEGIPSYLRETPSELPDFVDELPQAEKEPVRMGEGVI